MCGEQLVSGQPPRLSTERSPRSCPTPSTTMEERRYSAAKRLLLDPGFSLRSGEAYCAINQP
jgi:hypothetical protein